ncbi:uncharacterized protein BO66DRAFT_252792 [Aspergillus aculeatinus CBS 121060]|uniref:Uncharacterized protein n=1 Tax=Aspergillus aculeatinus CBS 121060 TaxID=1448322 RepID=A0ACD1HI28_9EURO|nr:hypothetical protein BO66DRAFT_252792 [Aspergillus aculeatinus CBS 121060]RAH73018.1 hypothetical protein BO66DRAFT_252792 [Aspergillus aculeatinus CBS 121060]
MDQDRHRTVCLTFTPQQLLQVFSKYTTYMSAPMSRESPHPTLPQNQHTQDLSQNHMLQGKTQTIPSNLRLVELCLNFEVRNLLGWVSLCFFQGLPGNNKTIWKGIRGLVGESENWTASLGSCSFFFFFFRCLSAGRRILYIELSRPLIHPWLTGFVVGIWGKH